jgi:hypothetical protein
MSSWKLDHHLKRIRKEVDALENFRITDHLTLGKFGRRLQDLPKDVEPAANLIARGKASSEQVQSFLDLAPRLAALSQKALTGSAEVAQAFFGGPAQPEGPPR